MQTFQKWEDFQCLHSHVVKTLYQLGFTNPTSIQNQVFQNYKHYYDFLVASQTGSGKTLCFAAPIVSDLLNLSQKMILPNKPLCLVMTPTRQLAIQIQQLFSSLIVDTSLRKICILGGLSIQKQLRVLREKSPHIIIGTPGRIHELLNQNQLNFESLKFLVLDEADRMIQMGHYIQLDEILCKIFLPKLQEYFEKDFHQINNKLSQAQQKGQFFIVQGGKKKKINFNINSMQTEKLFEVPLNLFQIEGEPLIAQVNQQEEGVNKKTRNKSKVQQQAQQNIIQNEQQQKQQSFIEALQKLKRKIFFISATLTRQFKGTKYFIKKQKSSSLDKKKQKQKKQNKQQNQYIPKLKALLSRVKFDVKPKIIDQSSQIFLPAKLKQKYCFCDSDIDKMTIILCYIKQLPQNSKIIIFTNTIRASKRVKYFINSAGYKTVTLHSHMMQKHRIQKLQKFQNSKSNILISTDIAARGLDFNIDNVVQFSVPINGDTYVHRVGRTARANREGQALALISQKDATRWQQISETLQSSDSTRKAVKYCPLQSTYKITREKVQQFEWIRLNQEKQQNKRIQKLNEIEAQQFGLQAQNLTYKPKRVSQQQQRIHNHKIQNKIKQIQKKNKIQTQKEVKVEVGDGKVWKKNKLVMSLDQIKKFL